MLRRFADEVKEHIRLALTKQRGLDGSTQAFPNPVPSMKTPEGVIVGTLNGWKVLDRQLRVPPGRAYQMPQPSARKSRSQPVAAG